MSERYEGMWDFSGKAAPMEDGSSGGIYSGQETFSLGCFQWEASSRKGKLKKGPVMYRVKGFVDNPSRAYAFARAYCAKKNAEVEVEND